ncbi:ArsB/NhaD family transporter [Salsuginibacillus kocurii]|uniref:ArsB/NhaD family transporter n=1 Tax=Salsuginibacillus kocurii TaxID=427078 RepID=UPI00036EDFBC|nr:ArsB/NhaD family transporter [Salsuginibacillus kocurii]
MTEVAWTLAIFIISYAFLIFEKGNRALVAVAGGTAMVFVGVLDLNAAFFQYVDWHTLTLLLAMMILVLVTSQSGLFEYMAIKAAQFVGGRALPLFFLLAAMTAVGSAFLNNVTTVLLLAPMAMKVTGMLNVPSLPYLLAIILASNIGGTATLIGDPPNLMIGQAVPELTFNDFLVHLGPPVLVIFICVMLGLACYYRRSLQGDPYLRNRLMNMEAKAYIKNSRLMVKSVSVLTATLIGFTLQPFLGVELTAIAMAGALLILFISYQEVDTEALYKDVEWVTIFFFVGLFILVGGLEEQGVIDELAQSLIYATKGDVPTTSLLILWMSGVLSGFVDNVPFVAAMIPIIEEFEQFGVVDLDPLWWSLALGACLGGNATLIGSTANVVVAGLAAKAGTPFSYMDFLKIGVPVVFLSFIIATVYVLFRYLLMY